MHVLSQYSDSNGVVKLPHGAYELADVISDSIKITSEDPKNPAMIVNRDIDRPCLTLLGTDSSIEGVSFIGEGKAISLRGREQTVERCIFRGNKTSILSEFKAYLRFNNIQHFKQDAIRFCSDFTVMQGNVIGMLHPDSWGGSHKDCAQGYAGAIDSPLRHKDRYSGEHSLKGIEFIDNVLFDYPGSPLQGLFIADGRAEGWLVENNKIMLFSHHGITLRGSKFCTLRNNTLTGTAKINVLPARKLMDSPNQDTQNWGEIEDDYSCTLGIHELPFLDQHNGVCVNTPHILGSVSH